jgi:hypothetical protein
LAKRTALQKTLTGLAGEYHVLAQLAERGIVGALTLGSTKSVDILAHTPATDRLYRVEVKTTCRPLKRDRIFGTHKFYCWPMSEKHEAIAAPDLIYCFVSVQGPGAAPRIFVVPSAYVAKYVANQHRTYRKSRGFTGPDENTMRMFRVPEHDPDGFAENWDIFLQ